MLLFLLFLLALSREQAQRAPPVRCAQGAPFLPTHPVTVLAIDRAVRDGAAWYQHRLLRLRRVLEGPAGSLAAQEALDDFIELFCRPPYFKGFNGTMTGGELVTDHTQLRELYSHTHHIPTYSELLNGLVQVSWPDRASQVPGPVFANYTAFSREHYIDRDDSCKEAGQVIVLGSHQSEWVIDGQGRLCLASLRDEAQIMVFPGGPPMLVRDLKR